MTFFKELEKSVKKSPGWNSNFGFQQLDWNTRVWLYAMCELIDKKLDEIDEKIYKGVKDE